MTVTVNIHEAKTQLSKLVERAVKRRLGFLTGEITVPQQASPEGN